MNLYFAFFKNINGTRSSPCHRPQVGRITLAPAAINPHERPSLAGASGVSAEVFFPHHTLFNSYCASGFARSFGLLLVAESLAATVVGEKQKNRHLIDPQTLFLSNLARYSADFI